MSGLLTAIYMFTTLFRAYFPDDNFDIKSIKDVKDPGWQMCVPFIIFSVCMIVMSFTAPAVINYFDSIAGLMR